VRHKINNLAADRNGRTEMYGKRCWIICGEMSLIAESGDGFQAQGTPQCAVCAGGSWNSRIKHWNSCKKCERWPRRPTTSPTTMCAIFWPNMGQLATAMRLNSRSFTTRQVDPETCRSVTQWVGAKLGIPAFPPVRQPTPCSDTRGLRRYPAHLAST